ncbi:1-acyl-sn-glycerol-3-phosphate acyltransferase [Kribbella sp. VKM Ac-2571]|uniref:lysophospholipid acyltransferase family protein n=1 Tax=Kribbella sp. VKM Ac-2571 TaxID=2512222 RepID=UPI00105C6E6F|nr:lysophospholipid acyltransferase family protein [Kribbella sp. VKM Ac-2571]TDO49745.1 1-acyl-sn-glycerol-3-phosphate acyltransferase [Kribbella sp. VKM Ac-2571]
MADADVIPIGSAGRPGRGSGRRTTPSAAARALAGQGGRGKKNSRARAQRDERVDADVTASRASKSGPATGRPSAEEPVEPVGAVPDVDGPEAPAGSEFAGLEQAVRGLFGEDGERRVAEWLAFLRRRLTGEYELDEFGYDSDLTDQVLLPMLRPMVEKWFRVEVRGIENIPSDGSALIVANHSGTMPLDGLVTQVVVADHTGRPLRTLAADLVFQTPFVGELSRKGGATLANNDDAERLLRQGNLVGVWPEGFKGLGKPFSERYKLQRFGRGGFVSAAMRTGVPIVPCSIVGAEEIYPLVGNIASLARLLGVPYIPVTPFFPLLGPLGLIPLPSKWLIEFGEPIRTDDFPDGAADDPMLVFNVTDQVRETIQQTLYTLLMQRRSVFF